ncbi:hypothetical protein RUM44_005581 [Polyplax serrata]|uniref:Methyltransferase-like protein 4 n=1 Tax=Polyplax serrata TaxID=468196 RepID=A0ABR1ADU2_POLSC
MQSDETGWVLSHESYINYLYSETSTTDGVKSFSLNSRLFDIKVPFKKKCHSKNELNPSQDVTTVKNAYNNLRLLYNFPFDPSELSEKSNRSAKSLADEFYCQLSRHPDFSFHGGNDSTEAISKEIDGEHYLIPKNCLFYCYDVEQLLKHLQGKQYNFILLDPPWWNKFLRRKRKKNTKFVYNMIFDKKLSSIPIPSLLSKEGIVAVWCTSAPSHINAVVSELFPAWNLEYLTQWFWLKVTKFGEPICDFSPGLGKQPFERIIFGIKKGEIREIQNPEKDKVIISIPSSIHSHKPPLCEVIKPYLPKEPKCLELFARYLMPTWTSYGNEVLKLQHLSLYEETVRN